MKAKHENMGGMNRGRDVVMYHLTLLIQPIIACRHYISLAILELHFRVFRLYITM